MHYIHFTLDGVTFLRFARDEASVVEVYRDFVGEFGQAPVVVELGKESANSSR